MTHNVLSIKIPIPPSLNKYLGNSHSHHIYSSDKAAVRWAVKAALNAEKCMLKAPIEKAMVRLTYHFPNDRRRDPDNYSGKFILDALVQERVIKDDSFNCIKLVLEKGNKDKEFPHVEVEVIDTLKL